MKIKYDQRILYLISLLLMLAITPGCRAKEAASKSIGETVALKKERPPSSDVRTAIDGLPVGRLKYESFHSKALNRELRYAIQLPDAYDRNAEMRCPVIYFLHGVSGDEKTFAACGFASVVMKLRAQGEIGNFIVAAPDGGDNFFVNAKNGPRYEDAIIKDLIPYIDKNYRTVSRPYGRAIHGISMGGFGALTIALKHPTLFSSVMAHGASLYSKAPRPKPNGANSEFIKRVTDRILGNPIDENLYKSINPIDIALTNSQEIKKSGLRILFDVGVDDSYGFQEANKSLSDALTKAGIEHQFHLDPGDHSQEYFLSVAPRAYAFVWSAWIADKRFGLHQ